MYGCMCSLTTYQSIRSSTEWDHNSQNSGGCWIQHRDGGKVASWNRRILTHQSWLSILHGKMNWTFHGVTEWFLSYFYSSLQKQKGYVSFTWLSYAPPASNHGMCAVCNLSLNHQRLLETHSNYNCSSIQDITVAMAGSRQEIYGYTSKATWFLAGFCCTHLDSSISEVRLLSSELIDSIRIDDILQICIHSMVVKSWQLELQMRRPWLGQNNPFIFYSCAIIVPKLRS